MERRGLICLDTNYLILALVPGSLEAERMMHWSRQAKSLLVPSVVWYEFISGPVNPKQCTSIRAMIHEVIPFEEIQSELAAHLWNETNRNRSMRMDAMIAATAIHIKSPLATSNLKDFEPFTPLGLTLL